MAAAKVIQIIHYVNGQSTSYFIPDPAHNILMYDYVSGSDAIDLWIRDWPKSPLTIKFPSGADQTIFRDLLTMGITGIYYEYDFGSGGITTPAEGEDGVFTLTSNIQTSATTTSTTTEAPATTTTSTTSSDTTTTTTSDVTTTTTLFPATLQWSYSKSGSVAASFRIYKNGSIVANTGVSASGTISVATGDTVYALITGTTTVLKTIDLNGGATGTDPLDTVSGTGAITLPTFTVARGNQYHIDGIAEPAV
jgi:hypothetical protein